MTRDDNYLVVQAVNFGFNRPGGTCSALSEALTSFVHAASDSDFCDLCPEGVVSRRDTLVDTLARLRQLDIEGLL